MRYRLFRNISFRVLLVQHRGDSQACCASLASLGFESNQATWSPLSRSCRAMPATLRPAWVLRRNPGGERTESNSILLGVSHRQNRAAPSFSEHIRYRSNQGTLEASGAFDLKPAARLVLPNLMLEEKIIGFMNRASTNYSYRMFLFRGICLRVCESKQCGTQYIRF